MYVKRSSLNRKEALFGWLFVLPEAIGILFLGVFPLMFSLYLSFCEWNLVGGLSTIKFIGFDNYQRMFQESAFYLALKNNLIFTLVTVPIGMAVALVFAVIIHAKLLFKDYFKVAFFIPYISSAVALAAIWAALLHPTKGPVNQFLISLGFSNPPGWLGSTKYALVAIMIIAIWQGIGYKIIIFIAGLNNISDEIYEASDIDGAGPISKFFKITLPLLAPTTFFLMITMVIASFKVFDIIAFLTEGGPNKASTVLVYYLYEEGFQNFRMGYASAISWFIFLLVLFFSFITWLAQRNNLKN